MTEEQFLSQYPKEKIISTGKKLDKFIKSLDDEDEFRLVCYFIDRYLSKKKAEYFDKQAKQN